jgi:hypothetical protein
VKPKLNVLTNVHLNPIAVGLSKAKNDWLVGHEMNVVGWLAVELLVIQRLLEERQEQMYQQYLMGQGGCASGY